MQELLSHLKKYIWSGDNSRYILPPWETIKIPTSKLVFGFFHIIKSFLKKSYPRYESFHLKSRQLTIYFEEKPFFPREERSFEQQHQPFLEIQKKFKEKTGIFFPFTKILPWIVFVWNPSLSSKQFLFDTPRIFGCIIISIRHTALDSITLQTV